MKRHTRFKHKKALTSGAVADSTFESASLVQERITDEYVERLGHGP
jgi:hypothetical protein